MNKRPKVGIGVLIIKGNKLLMGKRKNANGEGSYGTCGGHLEYGETLEEAVKREVFEEAGLKIKSLKFICVSNFLHYSDHYIDISFLGEVMDGKPKVKEPDKVESWEWYDLDNLPSPIFKPVEVVLESYKLKRSYNS